MYVVGLWLEHRSYRFVVDLGRALLLISAGLWMPLLAANGEGTTWVMQSLGLANLVLLALLYRLQLSERSVAALS
jgi:hypothetical protein